MKILDALPQMHDPSRHIKGIKGFTRKGNRVAQKCSNSSIKYLVVSTLFSKNE